MCARPKTWSPAEDATLQAAVAELGSCWGPVASRLPGRTAHQCRARWSAIRGTSRKRGKGHRGAARAAKAAAPQGADAHPAAASASASASASEVGLFSGGAGLAPGSAGLSSAGLGLSPASLGPSSGGAEAVKGGGGLAGRAPESLACWEAREGGAAFGVDQHDLVYGRAGAAPSPPYPNSLPSARPPEPSSSSFPPPPLDVSSPRGKASLAATGPGGAPAARDASPPGLPTPAEESGRGPRPGARRDSDPPTWSVDPRAGPRGASAGALPLGRPVVEGGSRPLTLGEALARSAEAGATSAGAGGTGSASQAGGEPRAALPSSLDRLFQAETLSVAARRGRPAGDLATPPREDRDDRAAEPGTTPPTADREGGGGAGEGGEGGIAPGASDAPGAGTPLRALPPPAPPAPCDAPAPLAAPAVVATSACALRTPVADRRRPALGLLGLASPASPEPLLVDGRLLASAGSPACILVDAQTRRAALLPRGTPSPARPSTRDAAGASALGLSGRAAWAPGHLAADVSALGPAARRVAGAEPHSPRAGFVSSLAYPGTLPYSVLGTASAAATVAAAGASSAAAAAAAVGDIGPELAAAWGGADAALGAAHTAWGGAGAALGANQAAWAPQGGPRPAGAPSGDGSGPYASPSSLRALGAQHGSLAVPGDFRSQPLLHPSKALVLSRGAGHAPSPAVKAASRLGVGAISSAARDDADAQDVATLAWLAPEAGASPRARDPARASSPSPRHPDAIAAASPSGRPPFAAGESTPPRTARPIADDSASPRFARSQTSDSTPPRTARPQASDSTPPRLGHPSACAASPPSRRGSSLSPRWGGGAGAWTPVRRLFESTQRTPPRRPRALTPALLAASMRGSPTGSPLLRFSATPPRAPPPDDGLSPFLALGDGPLSPERAAAPEARGDAAGLVAASPLGGLFRGLDSPLLPRLRGGGAEVGAEAGGSGAMPLAEPLDLSDRARADVDDVEAALRSRGRARGRGERDGPDAEGADYFAAPYSPPYAPRPPLDSPYAPYLAAGLYAGDEDDADKGRAAAELEAAAARGADRARGRAASSAGASGSSDGRPRLGLSPLPAPHAPPRLRCAGRDGWAWEAVDEAQGGSPLLSAKRAQASPFASAPGLRAPMPWTERKRGRDHSLSAAAPAPGADGSPPPCRAPTSAIPPHLPTPPSNARRTGGGACASHLLQLDADGDGVSPAHAAWDRAASGRKRVARGSAAVRNTLKALLGCHEGGVEGRF